MLGLTGPLLPVMSFLGRLPTATIQFGSVLLVARTSGSLAAAGLPTPVLTLLGAAAGATVPLMGPLARARRSGAHEAAVGTALSFESTLDETAFVLGPRLRPRPSRRPPPGRHGSCTAPRE